MIIYCIHRKQDEERYNQLVKELGKVNLSVSFIEPEPLDDNFEDKPRFNKAMDSLRRTTIKLVQEAKDKSLPYITIMEDDCKFHVEAYKAYEEKGLPDEFDFVHLNVTGRDVYGYSLTKGIYRPFFGVCCQYYVISSDVYDTYINLLKNSMVPIDEVTRHIQMKRGKSFAVEPLPVYHEKNRYSTLRGKEVKY
jgi:hypothetical protein